MQTGGNSLLPDQKVKIARENTTLQKLRSQVEQHPDEAAAFAASMSKPKTAARGPPASARSVEKVGARCSAPTPSLPMQVPSSVWIECHTPDGHKFFHHLFTQTSRWDLPSPPPPVASIPLPPSPPPPLKPVPVARGGAALNQTRPTRTAVQPHFGYTSAARPSLAESEDALREKMWARERLERAACSVCVSSVYGTVCSGCSRCPRHCVRLTRLTTARVSRYHWASKARAVNALCERMYVYIIYINLEVGLRPGNERRRRLTR